MAAKTATPARAQENRRGAILDAAARAFARHGHAGTSIREIAADAGVQPSSLYYFFPSKDDIYEAVYQRGVERILDAVEQSVSRATDPWDRMQRAATAHLEALLQEGDYNTLVANIAPKGDGRLELRLVRHRDQYEALFAGLVQDLPLPPEVDRKLFRLTLLGALNGVPSWYRPGGIAPESIAVAMIAMFRNQLDIPTGAE